MGGLYSWCVAFCDRLRYNRKSNVNEGLAMKQQGSIIGYVVVGTVLTLALVGGVLIVKNSHNSSARQVASTTATDAKKKESTQSNKSANDKLVDSLNSKSTEASKSKETKETQSQDKKNTTSTATNGATSGASSTTAQSQSQSTQSTQSQSSSTPAATPSTSSSTPSQTQSTQQVSALPQTGPAESLAAVVAVSSLAGVALAYRKSRTPAL